MAVPTPSDRTQPRKEQIVEAAREAFRRDGISATLLRDVASAAGVARPNLYRYFPSREALILEVLIEEIRAVNKERWRQFPLEGPVRPLLENSLIVGHELATDEYLARVAFAGEAMTITADLIGREPSVLAAQYEYWGPLLEYGRARHEISPRLNNEEIVRFFFASHVFIAEHPELIPHGDIRAWICNFIVPPVLAAP